jgi:Putative DNA-binding domain
LQSDELAELIKKGESQTVDFKASAILSDPIKVAKLMVAFANNLHVSTTYGGLILIGVNNDGSLEGMLQKQGHEEHIMNIARDRCYPSIAPKFEALTLDNKTVYVVVLPKMKVYPHALKLSDSNAYYVRVGTTVRVATSEELQELFVSSGKTTINQAIQRLRESIPSYNGPYRSVLVTPEYLVKDIVKLTQQSELRITNQLNQQALVIGDAAPTQNAVIYSFNNNQTKTYSTIDEEVSATLRAIKQGQDNTDKGYFATVNREGLIYYREPVNESSSDGYKGLHVGRTLNVIKSMINFAQTLYQENNYYDPCLLKFEAGNVANFPLINTDYFFRPIYRFQTGNVLNMDRDVSAKERKTPNTLLEGIAIELCRSFGLHISEEEAKTFLARLSQ